MTAVLSWSDRRTQLGVLMLDCLLTEEVDFASQVSVYPVETGVVISDHVTQGVETIRLGGVISTADASGGAGNIAGIAGAFGVSLDRSAKVIDVIEALNAMHRSRALVRVATGQMLYENYAFTNLNAKRSSDGMGGNWLSIHAEMIKVRKVSLKMAEVPPAEVAEPPAQGRAGATGTPAGRTTPSRAAANSQSTAPVYNQPQPFQSTAYRTLQTARGR